mgnify:CR=1 FL=1
MLVTVLVVVVSVNAINFIDGLDGLAAGIVGIGSLAFFTYSQGFRAGGANQHLIDRTHNFRAEATSGGGGGDVRPGGCG